MRNGSLLLGLQARVVPGGEQLVDVYAEILRPYLSDVLRMTVLAYSNRHSLRPGRSSSSEARAAFALCGAARTVKAGVRSRTP